MTLGNRIKELREKNNISQEKMSLDINVSRQTISKWENDTALPDSNNISVLCEYFNVTADYLLNGKEEEKQKNVIFDKKWLTIYIIYLIIGTVVLTFGILFLTVDVFKNSVKITGTSSFIEFPVGIILIVISAIIFLINGIKLIIFIRDNKKK